MGSDGRGVRSCQRRRRRVGWCCAGGFGRGVADLSGEATAIGAAAIGAAAAAVDGGVLGLRLPTSRRQVDPGWLGAYRGWVYGAGYGLQLGMGVTTIMSTALVPAAFALASLTSSAPAGAAVGAAFGLFRALPLLKGRRLTDAGQLRSFHQQMASADGIAGRAATATAVLISAVAVATLLAGGSTGR